MRVVWRRVGDGGPPAEIGGCVRQARGVGDGGAAMPPVGAATAGGGIDGRGLARVSPQTSGSIRPGAKRGGADDDDDAVRDYRALAQGFGRLHHRVHAALSGVERGATRAAEEAHRLGAGVPIVLLIQRRHGSGFDWDINSAAGPGIGEGEISEVHFIVHRGRLFGKHSKKWLVTSFHRC